MTELALIAVVGVIIVVAVSFVAPKVGVAAPVLLVVVGVACSFIPGAPTIMVEPEWILMIVLPPILYSAAVNVPVKDFRRELGTITALSVVLVVVSAFATGLLIWWLLPDIGLPAAVALGAVISPPDAVAATSIGKRLGLPPKLVTILEGEGLVNDATALVMLRTAVAAVAGSISFWGALGDFAFAVLVGIAIGAVVGVVTVWVRSHIREQPVLTTAISFVVPFLAFIPAEELRASGVLATVTAGLITGHESAKRFSAHDRSSERTNWRTIQLLLEHGVFLLMGFEVTTIIGDVNEPGEGLGAAVGIALLAVLTLILVRTLFVAVLVTVLRARQRRAPAAAARIDNELGRLEDVPSDGRGDSHGKKVLSLRRRHADLRYLTEQGLGWRGGAVLSWSGMRGVITLAAAQTLPLDIPHHAELILIAFVVALVTLVVQGSTLPLLIRTLGIQGTSAEHRRRETARLAEDITTASRDLLASPALRRDSGETFDPEVLIHAREQETAASIAFAAMLDDPDTDVPIIQQRELRRQLLDAQQGALLDARASGTYDSHTLERAQRYLDAEATRLNSRP